MTSPARDPAESLAPADPDLQSQFEQYGQRVAAIEPGGTEPIPLAERHGMPIQLLWTWTSPNLEFASVFVGFLGVAFFGLSFWQAAAAIILGNGLASLAHFGLSQGGPRYGVPQMVLNRVAFGYRGNRLPATLMSISAGIGWFAVNSVSGAFALASLTDLPAALCLLVIVTVQIVVATFGHNLVQAFERYAFPVLAIVFAAAVIGIFVQADFSAPSGGGGIGGFLLALAASFGYSAGWNPYASDYTRYLSPTVSLRTVGAFAASGLFLSTTVLGLAGAASVSVIGAATANPVDDFAGALPTVLGALTLLAVALGSCAANVLNVYSSALALLSMGIRPGGRHARAVVALVLGIIGGLVAWTALDDAGHKYESFLLVLAYWLGPWLAVIAVDRLVRGRRPVEHLLFDRSYENFSGPVAMLVGMVVSISLFSNQELYVGPLAGRFPGLGDVTFIVGFLITGLIYSAGLRRRLAADPAEL